MIVAHDDLDLPVGDVRLKMGGGAGGQKGIIDLKRVFKDVDFARVRVGIGRPPGGETQSDSVSNWVLGAPGRQDQELLSRAVDAATESIRDLLSDGFAKAQGKRHTSSGR